MNKNILAGACVLAITVCSQLVSAQSRTYVLRQGEMQDLMQLQRSGYMAVACDANNYPQPPHPPMPPPPPPQPICDRSGITNGIARVVQYIHTAAQQSCAIRVPYCSDRMTDGDPYNREKRALLDYFSGVNNTITRAARDRACDMSFMMRAVDDFNRALDSGKNRNIVIDGQTRRLFEDNEMDYLKVRF